MVLLGKINFATMAIPLARLHCRPLKFCLPRRMNEMSSINSQMTLTREARDSMRWWAKLDDESSHASNSNRRIHDRVGCSNGLDVHPGCVDGLGQIETY